MDKPNFEGLRSRASRPLSERSLETLVGVAVFLWTFGQLVFSHSIVATLSFVGEYSLLVCFQAAAFGCSIAVIAAKRFGFNPIGLAAVGGLLFAVLTLWNRQGNMSLLVLALILIAAREMNLKRLVRFYVAAATAAMVLILGLTAFGIIPLKLTTTGLPKMSGFGFTDRQVVGCLLTSIIISLAYVLDDARMRIPVALVCLVSGVACFMLLGTKRMAAFIVLVGVLVFFKDRIDRRFGPLVAREEFRWFVAVVPIAIILMCLDSQALYPVMNIIKGGYHAFPTAYGMVATACFAMLYVRTVLLAKPANNSTLPWLLLGVTMLISVFDGLEVYLEFNGLLLLLAIGMSGKLLGEPEDSLARGGE